MSSTKNILVLNGPNLNKLGTREPEIYGSDTLKDVEDLCELTAKQVGLTVTCKQSNHEGELVTWIQEAAEDCAGIVINAGAYTHTSIAILDALKMAALPIIEVHLSNIFEREEFRHHSYISPVASGVLCGFGLQGYGMALCAMANILETEDRKES